MPYSAKLKMYPLFRANIFTLKVIILIDLQVCKISTHLLPGQIASEGKEMSEVHVFSADRDYGIFTLYLLIKFFCQ